MEIQPVPPQPDDLSILSSGIRLFMVNKVVSVLVPKPDINARYDARMLEFIEYVKYMERKTFERVQTRDEYYAELAKIIFRIQNQLSIRPKGPADDPYGNIPFSHELADFLGLTQQELEEFDNEWNPQIPRETDEANSKEKITMHIRLSVIDKLGSLLFPAPDPFAYFDGRMDKITNQLKQIEEEAYRDCEDRDEYFDMVSLNAYRLQKSLKKKGESYVENIVKYPTIVLRSEIINPET